MIPKFRIFDKKKKCFLGDFTMEIDKFGIHVLDEFNYVVDEDDRVLMQSTGLHDKNGKEIFEGDVVECYTEGLSVVEFVGGVFGLRCNGYFEGFNLVNGQCVIIGNIHEHSHLLDDGGIRE